jgi:hypothetical protein
MLNQMLNQKILAGLTIALGTTLGTIVGTGQAMAAADLSSVAQPQAVPLQISDAVPQTTCKLALVAQAQNPVSYGSEKIVGRVYNVIGNTVYLELDDGTTTTANLSIWEKGKLGNIIGRRIVVTPYYCNRANLDTALKWKPGKAIEVPPLTFSNSAPVMPPVTPRPAAPTPEPAAQPDQQTQPEIIPQTW